MGKVLELELYVYGTYLFGKVLKQDEEIVKRGAFKFKASNGINIYSSSYPDIGFDTIVVRGSNEGKDGRTFSQSWSTEEKAIAMAEEFKAAVDELNAKYETKALEVEFVQYEDIICGKVLRQDTSLVPRDTFRFRACNGVFIRSVNSPQLDGHYLYVLGSIRSSDSKAFYYRCDSKDAATELIGKLNEAVDELNASVSKASDKKSGDSSLKKIM